MSNRILSKDDRQTIALTRLHMRALEEAREDRTGTKALYDCCAKTKEDIRLELNLLDSAEANSKKLFPLFVPWFGDEMRWGISAQITQQNHEPGKTAFGKDFQDACKQAYTHGSGTCLL